MKKLLTTVFAAGLLIANASAQAPVAKEEKAPMSKEDKAKAKAAKEQALTDAIKELDIPKENEDKLRNILDEAAEKGKQLKNDASLSEEQKAEKKEAINTEKNNKLKELLGEEKYKKWNNIRKKQKEAMPAQPHQ